MNHFNRHLAKHIQEVPTIHSVFRSRPGDDDTLESTERMGLYSATPLTPLRDKIILYARSGLIT